MVSMLQASPLLDLEQFGAKASSIQPRNRAIQRLYLVFVRMLEAQDQEQRVAGLLDLVGWLRGGRGLPSVPDAEPSDLPFTLRLRVLLAVVEGMPEARAALSRNVSECIAHARTLDLLARLGLPEDRSFLSEMADRLWKWILPEGQDDRDAIQILGRLFPSRHALFEFGTIPVNLFARLQQVLLSPHDGESHPLSTTLLDALRLLSLRLSAAGLFDALRTRSPETPLEQSPFYQLRTVTERFIESLRDTAEPSKITETRERCKTLATDCHAVVKAVFQNLERSGVSVDVVYRLESISKGLRRYTDLLDLLWQENAELHSSISKRFFATLIDARLDDGELSEIVRENLHLLARRIIERAGETGEHYITTTRREYAHMLASASGGGVLTAATTALKYLIMWPHFPPFVEGLLSAANYAGSFLIMQLLGFTLATKQPSMTAAAVAASMRELAGQNDLSGLVTMIARVTRSQLAAAAGNIGLVIPTSVAFDLYWQSTHGRSFLDTDTASYILHSLNPFSSGTVFYAALTGVLLWLASIGAGYVENWAVYRGVPQAIAEHRIRRIFGRRFTTWASRAFHRNISGVGGNVTLGTLLGLTPVFGKFMGIPLDVRHVTLSTGALTLAVCALPHQVLSEHDFREAALGVLIIGILNFGVSFILSLLVALRAKEVSYRDRFRLLVSVVATLIRSPMQFVFPPATTDVVRVHGPVSLHDGDKR